MGNTFPERANFEDVLQKQNVLINVLDESDQTLLIQGTVSCKDEVGAVEKAILEKKCIIIYGKNSHDDRVLNKYAQIKKLKGLPKIYVGGLFEWILLNELYGNDRFPLSSKVTDIYQYRPK